MSQQVKSFFSGVVVQTMVIAFVLWVSSTFAEEKLNQLNNVVQMAEKSQHQLIKLTTTLEQAVKSIDSVNDALGVYTKYHAQNLVHITGALVEHRKELDRLDAECDSIKDNCLVHKSEGHK